MGRQGPLSKVSEAAKPNPPSSSSGRQSAVIGTPEVNRVVCARTSHAHMASENKLGSTRKGKQGSIPCLATENGLSVKGSEPSSHDGSVSHPIKGLRPFSPTRDTYKGVGEPQ